MTRREAPGLPEESVVERLFGLAVCLIVVGALCLIMVYKY
jgi:hypothetical protein